MISRLNSGTRLSVGLLAIVLAAGVAVAGNTGTIRGRVTDKATEPPGGAAVTRGTGRGKGAGGPSVSCVKTR